MERADFVDPAEPVTVFGDCFALTPLELTPVLWPLTRSSGLFSFVAWICRLNEYQHNIFL
jgi:hypothetical protein